MRFFHHSIYFILMRLRLFTTAATSPVPFDHLHKLTGVFHKWIGENNDLHGDTSLYATGWLKQGEATAEGLKFGKGATWDISSHDKEVIPSLVEGILAASEMFCGMRVKEIKIIDPPAFDQQHRFFADTPVLVKRLIKSADGKNSEKFYLYNEPESDHWLTETFRYKLRKAGLSSEGVSLAFDRSYPHAKTKVVQYHQMRYKASLCPIVAQGSPEQLTFLWNVGAGNCTGIGFGALK